MTNPSPQDELRSRRRSALIDVARRLSSTENIDDLIDDILGTSREVMDCEVCSILLHVEETEGDLQIRSTLQVNQSSPVTVPHGKGIAGQVFTTREPINIEDAQKDPRHYTPSSDKSGLVTRAMLTIPLLEGDRCLGVMQAINPNNTPHFDSEDQDIFETFGSLISVTLMRLESQKIAIREAQARQELDLAREIQQSFLPEPKTQFDNLMLEAFYEPASEIGGDFYFWHLLEPGNHVLFGIGDVTGKGLPAALDMTRASTLIASTAQRCLAIGFDQWVTELNEKLCRFMTAGRFIAINCVLLHLPRRRAHLCIAGLPNPKFFDGLAWRDVTAPTNPPLGIAPTVDYQTTKAPLGAAQQLLLYSDGILELTQEGSGAAFEDEAFESTLANLTMLDSKISPLEQVVSAWREFGGPRPAYLDDATLLMASDLSPRPPTDLAFTCNPDNIGEARAFFEEWAQYAGFDEQTTGLLILGADEVLTNIVRHAYPCPENAVGGEGPVTCRVKTDHDALIFNIDHRGSGISNEEFQKLVTEPSPDTRIGGLGGHVINEVFDQIDFQTTPEHSRITLAKNWL
ncbi:MAG: SpoIIE family protein phosphatase [Verrucomicrobiota bacterium]